MSGFLDGKADKVPFETHLGDDARYLVKDQIDKINEAPNKVDKVTGKGLSANDFTGCARRRNWQG